MWELRWSCSGEFRAGAVSLVPRASCVPGVPRLAESVVAALPPTAGDGRGGRDGCALADAGWNEALAGTRRRRPLDGS